MQALKDFQKSQGLKPDGILGRLTFGAVAMAYRLTPIQTAHFLAQLHHESAGFRFTEESFNYSAERLLEVFPKYYDADLAKKHERKPSVIANHVYGGRMGNDQPNDGWHFRGRGYLQLTGRNNYEAFAAWLDVPDVVARPDLVAGKYAMASAIWYFKENGIFEICRDLSEKTVLAVSRAVNLGSPYSAKTLNGLEDRKKQTIFYSKFVT